MYSLLYMLHCMYTIKLQLLVVGRKFYYIITNKASCSKIERIELNIGIDKFLENSISICFLGWNKISQVDVQNFLYMMDYLFLYILVITSSMSWWDFLKSKCLKFKYYFELKTMMQPSFSQILYQWHRMN